MTDFRTRLQRRTVLAAGLAAAMPLARAQAYPARPVRLLVGYSAGGGVDAIARMLSQRLSTVLGQQVVVENRTGASGAIAADLVAKAQPDGYNLVLGESGLLIAQHLGGKLPFDPLTAFTPVASVAQAPLLIVAGPNVPASNPRELIELLKKNPGKFSYATSGVGTVHHLGFEVLKARTNSFIVHIPYRGAAQIIPDVISGQVPFGVVSAAGGLSQARSGRVKAVALMSTGKLPGAENVPALAEALPGFDVAPRLFVLAPPQTPAPIVDRLNEAIRTVVTSADFAQTAAQQGTIPAYLAPAPLAAEMKRESGEWARIIQQQKVTLE
ncbi:MAG TPA: tripartite tricarboxylate transporter substrate-binding protein [Ramlibacter sp.]|nr:tripartite tricarboxylate transporter substrate-binding protein [Ramlibacter sp.]